MERTALAVLGAAMLAGCGLLTQPDWVRERLALAPCGDLTLVGDDPVPDENNRCLVGALESGTGAELIVRHRQPTDGLPVDSFTRILPDRSGELILHIDPDNSGADGWELHRCRGAQVSDLIPGSVQLNDCEQVADP